MRTGSFLIENAPNSLHRLAGRTRTLSLTANPASNKLICRRFGPLALTEHMTYGISFPNLPPEPLDIIGKYLNGYTHNMGTS